MTTTNGTSVLGLQLIGGFSTTTSGWQLRFASAPQQNRRLRLGTALHCRRQSTSRFPVVAVYKLFGGGLSPDTLVIPNSSGTELWVDWFYPGVVWAFERPA